jgi:hypothetical protein
MEFGGNDEDYFLKILQPALPTNATRSPKLGMIALIICGFSFAMTMSYLFLMSLWHLSRIIRANRIRKYVLGSDVRFQEVPVQ